MSRRFIGALVTVVALGGTPILGGAQILDTRPAGQGFFWQNFSSGVMLGQSLSTPGAVNTFLKSLTLYDVRRNSGSATYTAFIDVWNSGTRKTGAQVWSTSGSSLTTSFSNLTFAVNTQLIAGTQYLFGFFASAANGNFFMGHTPYGGGSFYYQNGATPSNAWSSQFANYDIEFSANFVPEPSSLILFGSGLVGVIGLAVVRRQSIV